jgi:TusA-related sulfurtransferase
MPAKEQPMTEHDTPPADGVLDAAGETCAGLTPLIRAKMRELDSGGVLEVRTDDPSARVDIPAWSRLTGNGLITVIEGDSEHTRFFLQKK